MGTHPGHHIHSLRLEGDPMTAFTTLDIVPWMNRRGFTTDRDRRLGQGNAWGNSFPEEEVDFDTVHRVGGVPFLLQRKETADHIEALGQQIAFDAMLPTRSVALLCCGEMGDRDLDAVVVGADANRESLRFYTRSWLVRPADHTPAPAWVFSHLHYPGDYELALLCPALFCARCTLAEPRELIALELGINPFFHIFAVTSCRDA